MRLRHLYSPARIAFIALVRLRTSGQRLCMIRATRPMSRADNRADGDITTRGSGMPRFETGPAPQVVVDVSQERRRRVSEEIELAIVRATKATKANASM